MPLDLFYTMVQKVKNDQKLKSRGGPALMDFQHFFFLPNWLLSHCTPFGHILMQRVIDRQCSLAIKF